MLGGHEFQAISFSVIKKTLSTNKAKFNAHFLTLVANPVTVSALNRCQDCVIFSKVDIPATL